MAATAISLRVRATRNPTLLHHFSSTSSSLPPPNPSTEPQTPNSPPPNPQSRFSSYFSDVKASLRKPPRQQQGQQTASRDQILKNLAEFRQRSAPPTSGEKTSSPAKRVSFQELFRGNLTANEGEPVSEVNKGGKIWLDAVRQRLSQRNANSPKTNEVPLSLKKYKESFTLRPPDMRNQPSVTWSPQKLTESMFSKDFQEKKDGDTSPTMKTEFLRMYSYKELGEKLRKLRPEGKREGGFSLQELNERLLRLRESEQREMTSNMGQGVYTNLKESLMKLRTSENKQTTQKLVVLDYQTPSFMQKPPKEHLVEKYFHPDNMSSAEKLKIELQKVRGEFKMSESDCGSSRVQVALLTTKIKHLATVLHKKDKHSRKGLQEMIQRRKKLLKYLRRTDWDSYTFVLSKLGLRDNPDYKN